MSERLYEIGGFICLIITAGILIFGAVDVFFRVRSIDQRLSRLEKRFDEDRRKGESQ